MEHRTRSILARTQAILGENPQNRVKSDPHHYAEDPISLDFEDFQPKSFAYVPKSISCDAPQGFRFNFLKTNTDLLSIKHIFGKSFVRGYPTSPGIPKLTCLVNNGNCSGPNIAVVVTSTGSLDMVMC